MRLPRHLLVTGAALCTAVLAPKTLAHTGPFIDGCADITLMTDTRFVMKAGKVYKRGCPRRR